MIGDFCGPRTFASLASFSVHSIFQFCHIISLCAARLPSWSQGRNQIQTADQWAATYNQRWKNLADQVDQDVGKSMLNSHCPAGGSGCARLLQCRCDGIGSARDPVDISSKISKISDVQLASTVWPTWCPILYTWRYMTFLDSPACNCLTVSCALWVLEDTEWWVKTWHPECKICNGE